MVCLLRVLTPVLILACNSADSVFYTLQALLFAAWVCIIKYFDMAIFKSQNQTPAEDSKADFFRGITIFSWVMVVLLALMFVLSFDKLCSRSSPWTLTVSHGAVCDILSQSKLVEPADKCFNFELATKASQIIKKLSIDLWGTETGKSHSKENWRLKIFQWHLKRLFTSVDDHFTWFYFGVSPRKKEDVGWRINLKLGFTFFINLTIYFRSFRFFHLYWSFALFAGTVYPLHLVRFVDRLLWKHDKTRYRLGKGVQKCVQVIQTERVSPSDRAGKQNSVATMVCCKL